MIQPLKSKYWPMYFNMAYAAQMQTEAKREKVGCVYVLESGIIIPGYNGQPPGHHTNCCENTPVVENGVQRLKTDASVIHAEENGLRKAIAQGLSLEGSHLFTTVSPCPNCCTLLVDNHVAAVHYDRQHDDVSGHIILDKAGIEIHPR